MRPSLFLIGGIFFFVCGISMVVFRLTDWTLPWTISMGIFTFAVPVDTDAKPGYFEMVMTLLALFILSALTVITIALTSPFWLSGFLTLESVKYVTNWIRRISISTFWLCKNSYVQLIPTFQIQWEPRPFQTLSFEINWLSRWSAISFTIKKKGFKPW